MKRLCVFVITTAILLSSCTEVSNRTVIQEQINVSDKLENVIVDKDYLFALNTIDSFLIAWLKRDATTSISLLTEKVKNSISEEDLKWSFIGVSNPHHQGFEVLGAKRIDEKTIRFHVWLYEYYTGDTPQPVKRPSPYVVDIVKTNEGQWLVNNLPKQME